LHIPLSEVKLTSLIEAGKVHRGINTGNIPVKLVASLTSEKGKPASSPAP
jgi:hypothetical protein